MNPLTATCAETELPGEGAAPDWVHLLPAGLIKGRDGRSFHLGNADQVIEASEKGADLPIDYEHQIDDPTQRAPDGAVRAAGWIKQLEVRSDGIWGRVEWTETARNMIAAKEYRYISPVLVHTQLDAHVVRLLGASLVHRPNLHLKALSSEQSKLAPNAADLTSFAMALGLHAGADSAAILSAIQAHKVPDPAKYVPVAAVVELMRERHNTLALVGEREAMAMVETAMNGGYLTPAMKPWAIALCTQNPESFEAFLSSAAPAYAHLFNSREWKASWVEQAAPDSPTATMAAQLGLDPKSFG